MDLGLNGRVALITGGGGALGSEMARAFVSEGVSVAICDINKAAADSVVSDVEQSGGKAVSIVADITRKEDAVRAVEIAERELGSLDILVNNAGFSRDGYLLKMDEEEWDAVHQTVLKGAFHCCRAALPGMMKRRFGRIINISSMAYLGNAGQTNYASAKAGLIGMTNALARESGKFNITCNAIAPGFIATDRLKQRDDFEKLEERALALTPLPRLGEPADVAKAVLYFSSSWADFVSAQTLGVSGGR